MDIWCSPIYGNCFNYTSHVMFSKRCGNNCQLLLVGCYLSLSMQFNWIDTTNTTLCGEDSETDRVIRCDIDFVINFVVPGLLLLATYIYGVYLFWGKKEHFDSLAEQVAIKQHAGLSQLLMCYLCIYPFILQAYVKKEDTQKNFDKRLM